jgi:hypothetical protein
MYFDFDNFLPRIQRAMLEFIYHCNEHILNAEGIVTYKGLGVTKITGSKLDDWICWHFSYNLS